MATAQQYRISVILLIASIFISIHMNAQKCYRAIYKYNIPNDFVNASKNFADTIYYKYNGNMRTKIAADSILKKSNNTHSTVQQIHDRELYKFTHNNMHFVFESCPEKKLYYPATNIDEHSYFLPDSNINLSFNTRSHSYTSINMKDYLVSVAKQNAIEDITVKNPEYRHDTVCYRLDTAKLHFKKTGKTKPIAKWNCNEYRPTLDDKYKLSVWASTELPYYITPMIFGIDIQGGIVEVHFDKGNYISLVHVAEIDEVTPIPAPCIKNNDLPSFIPLQNILGELD